MSWITLMAPTVGVRGLGSAQAGARWGWAEARSQPSQPALANRRAPQTVARLPHTATAARSAVIRASGVGDAAPSAPTPAPSANRTTSPAMAQSIAEAAQLLGRDEGDIWAEAAREWLSHHLGLIAIVANDANDANDDPPPTAPAAAVAARRAGRCWAAIDELLADLRAPAA